MLEVERLYHYTTVQSLALILKNKTLRLNPLSKMDDLQEEKSNSLQNYGQSIFVSSWTDLEEESIPMWKMYSSMDAGVRISMLPDPFQIFDLITNSFRDPTEDEWQNRQSIDALYPVVDLSKVIKQYTPANYQFGTQLCKIEYVNDRTKLIPNIQQIENGKVLIKLEEMGKYKNELWSFQREYRYRLITCPFGISLDINRFNVAVNLMTQFGGIKPTVDYIDLRLAENKLNDMVITTSPAISESNRIIVESLVKCYCPGAKIVESTLAGLVR